MWVMDLINIAVIIVLNHEFMIVTPVFVIPFLSQSKRQNLLQQSSRQSLYFIR